MSSAVRPTPIHPSLVRPVLLAGAERELALLEAITVFALVFGVGPHPLTYAMAVFLATLGHAALVRLAKIDSQGWRVFARHLGYRDFYPALAHPGAPPALVPPPVERS